MTKHMTASKLTHLAAILAASVALMATANIANAKGDHHHDNNGGGQFSNARQSMDGMEKRSEHRDKKKDKYTEKKKKGCENIIVPTKDCGVSSKDPVGNTRPSSSTASTTKHRPAAQRIQTATLKAR